MTIDACIHDVGFDDACINDGDFLVTQEQEQDKHVLGVRIPVTRHQFIITTQCNNLGQKSFDYF